MARKNTPLYHWSPIERRAAIVRHGLRPSMKSTASTWRAAYVCFADTPSWAWALSAGAYGGPGSEWDLWQTWLHDLTEPRAIRCTERPSGIYEVRTKNRVPKSLLWHVGTRTRGRTSR